MAKWVSAAHEMHSLGHGFDLLVLYNSGQSTSNSIQFWKINIKSKIILDNQRQVLYDSEQLASSLI